MAREGPGLSALARVQARPGDAPATGTVFRDSSKIGLEKKKHNKNNYWISVLEEAGIAT